MISIESLAARLPMLDARLRRAELGQLLPRLAGGPSLPEAILAWLEEGESEVQALEQDYDQTAAAFERSRDRGLLLAWLARHNGGRVAWRDWLASYQRLGIEVLGERTAVLVEQVGIREELLLKLLKGLLPSERAAPEVVQRLREQGRRWQVRKAAVEVLIEHVRMGGPCTDPWSRIQYQATMAQEHPWVRDACDGWMATADPDRALPLIRVGLRPADEARHFLLRRLRVERVAATWPHEAPAILEEQLGDPSEHVGVGLAAALVRLGSEEALLLAERLAESPLTRVRLAVAVYLGRAAPNLEARVLGRILSRRLQREVYRGVVVALCRASAAAVVAFPELALVLRAALDGVIQADREGESTEEAAAARRVCLRVADTGSSQLYGALAPRISSVVQNTKVFFSWKELGISVALTDDQIGMVLAELSREDLGLWAERHRDGLWLQRGDRLRIRTWRFLHELVHPAPNKRQSWSHMVGRDNRGSLRAPPQRMAEVTATTTPGERTLVERDGSWVPALPAVDDFLQLSAPARIYSAYGVTELRAAPSWFRRMVGKIRLTFAYPRLARLRTAALSAEEPSQRAAYLRTVERELGISVHFHLDSPAPPRMEQLRSSVSIAAALAWLGERRDAVLAPFASSQPALGWFAAGILASLLVRAAQRRESIRQARQKIPLVMGGWGTRGKSGTERIKAGLFHGLGYSVFVKTTGCEAMFISARPGLTAREIFIFRPQDKSSIWEQADMVEQAAGMGAQVMLWECMALRPQLVELLQQDWMRDDLVTLTNAFPDHEDVQGPAGHDIATVISTFMPCRSVAVTSEREFLPLFRERARERQSELDAVPAEEAELLGQDLLDLFPYQEHPRNIALVARVAERLGLDRMLAIATMAEFVVPDLGVLRIYPQVQVHGRFLRFINGMSANERTGCVSNWRRTGCDRIDVDQQPEQAIVVVVNNRADRVARSEVFARILVQDLAVDSFVLIGTNLTGLVGYVETALDAFVQELELRPEGLSVAQGEARISGWFARLRIGKFSVDSLRAKLECVRTALGRAGAAEERLWALVAEQREARSSLELTEVQEGFSAELRPAWEEALGPVSPAVGMSPEVATPATLEEAWAAWSELLAFQVIHHRTLKSFSDKSLTDLQFRALYRRLFLRKLKVIADSAATGDQIITYAARTVLPGLQVTVMGVQNIKGTGLDFAYRWVALGAVIPRLERCRAPEPLGRMQALRELLAFDDYGLIDAGTVAATLATPAPGEAEAERVLRERVQTVATGIHARRLRALTLKEQVQWWVPLLSWVEAVLDPLDAIRRAWVAARTLRELRHHTLSLGDAAATMQGLYTRQKGGWLVKWLRSPG